MAPNSEALKSRPWFHSTLTRLDPRMRSLLEERGVPPEDVLQHIINIRDKAWSIHPYPCIGMFSFAQLSGRSHPLYESTIVARLLKGEKLLDLGCGFAQEFRNLVSVGVDSSQLTGLDNHDGFIKLSYELFRDEATMKARFVVADMLDIDSIPSDMLGSFDIIWAGASFHLFNWEQQIKASIVAVKLLRDRAGAAIFGYQVGHEKGKERRNPNVPSGSMFLHDPESFERFWKQVGAETGTKWKVQSWMDERGLDDLRGADRGIRRQRFAVERVNVAEESSDSAKTAGKVAL